MKTPSLTLAACAVLLLAGCSSTKEEAPQPPKLTQEPSTAPPTPGGTMTTASGLQYRILASGPAGGHSPRLQDSVTVHYRGELINGSVFDSSYDRGEPTTFGVSQVIQGGTEALQLMKPGDKWLLCIPPHLGYGSRAMGSKIPPNSTLIFQVELLSVGGGM